jgi:hypothetical protein
VAVKDEASPLIRTIGLFWLASALAALDFDPWLPWVMTVFPLPNRRSLWEIAIVAAVLGLAATLAPRFLKVGRGILVWIGGVSTLALAFLGTPFVRPIVHFVAVLLALISTLLVILIWLRLRPKGAAFGTGANVATTVVTLVVMLLLGEAVFTLIPQSHAVGYTLAARLWFERYWRLRNSLGYRDREHVDTSAKKVFVLGDSFVSAVGLADLRDRLSERLQERLGPECRVYNLGMNGADTRYEYRCLQEHPVNPDVVILVYYLNDIEKAAAAAGRTVPRLDPYGNVPARVAHQIRRSYLLDFIYWRLPQRDLAGYEGTLESMYHDPAILALHLADLQRLVDYCRNKGIDLIVVTFPHLARPAETAPLLHPIVESLRAANVPVIEVAPLIAGRDPRLFYNNRNDAHPNARMNALLTDAVMRVLSQRKETR